MPIVGIGASAGGVDALRAFFDAMPAESGMAFIVILHLSPDYESNLTSILQQNTSLTVEVATDGTEVAPNHVYVIPPARRLNVQDGHLYLTEMAKRHEVSTIDRFFRSLAADQGANAVGVVLSGTGTDGTLGLRAIKEEGGVTMVQDPTETEYDHMPKSAIASGLIDLVLPVRDLAQKLVEYRDHAGIVQLPEKEDALDEDDRSILQKIFTRLYTTTGHDFSNYKHSTVLRRLERRLQLHALGSLADYLDLLREDQQEVKSLYKDFLISVTNFFRDPEAFEALEERVIPKLFEGKTAGDTVRVWVPGCATGEEAYSLGILMLEEADRLDHAPDLQIFATDVDEDALAFGREGLYPQSIETDVSEDRLKHFFKPKSSHYQVTNRLRDTILFAKHNVLADPPFSNLDLVSCRNLLIYLNQEMQEHVFRRMHYALNENGFLFLGRSEAGTQASQLFSTVDKSNNILQARSFTSDGTESLPMDEGPAVDVTTFDLSRAESGNRSHGPEDEPASAADLHHTVLMNEVASVLVNENHEIVHLTDRASQYLGFEGGTPSLDFLSAVPEELRPELRSALYQALENGRSTEYTHLHATIQGNQRPLTVSIRPIGEKKTETYAQIEFDENKVQGESSAERTGRETKLQDELDHTREQLQTTSEEYEAATEEMEAANEELLSMNEELQSKNEELETSKEELQSVNEELKTTNHELKTKIDELREANSDLENLMAATQIATLFLDRNLQIQRYTPRTTELFNIRPVDTGRPLSDFAQRFDYDGLLTDAERVLDTLEPIEREVHQSDDKWFLVRLRPYRTVQDTIEGIVLTFIDITERRRLERELVNATEQVRRQIGQDLHDMLSSDLAAAAMKADNLHSRLAEKNMEEAETLLDIVDAIRSGAEQARTLSHALVPVSLQEDHLAAALENLCHEQEELGELDCTFEGNRDESLPTDKETAMHLYRIAHEAVVNARQHADADHLWISLNREGDRLVMNVQDNGDGLPENLEPGLGLRSMQYRANLIGASLSIAPDDEGGTMVQCALPLMRVRTDEN